ncbi:hypothetical protein FPANT_3633 [Fusarium pseudoanthophilum]|uniref:Uncharacterized protein n=1 Tax=Fusarium pseudoanthophilum TaxID=48495 RepID=A0A8H5UVN8_9HYPO|nr:hypothetical protein FPANT_3633 [Fusarium pseudoanthophilum]
MVVIAKLLTLCSAALVVAAPAPAPAATEDNFEAWLGGAVLDKCLAAGDCQQRLLDNPYYVAANKTGLHKRFDCQGSGIHTIVTSGSTKVKFGSVNPHDLFHHVYDVCSDGGCDSGTPYSLSTKYTTALGVRGASISMTAQGVYSGWDVRNALAESLSKAASQNQDWQDEVFCPSGGRACGFGRLWQAYAPRFQQAALFDGCAQWGWMNAQTNGLTGVTGSSACSVVVGALGSIVGTLVPYGGLSVPIAAALCT